MKVATMAAYQPTQEFFFSLPLNKFFYFSYFYLFLFIIMTSFIVCCNCKRKTRKKKHL